VSQRLFEVLHGERLRELHDGALRHAVDDGVGLADEAGVGRDVDDDAVVLEQMRDRRLSHEEVAVDVDGHHLPVGRLGDLGEVLTPRDAGDVAQHVEPSALGQREVDRRAAVVGLGDIACARDNRAARLLSRRFQPAGVEVERDDSRALTRQPQCRRLADAGRRARDDGHAAVVPPAHDFVVNRAR